VAACGVNAWTTLNVSILEANAMLPTAQALLRRKSLRLMPMMLSLNVVLRRSSYQIDRGARPFLVTRRDVCVVDGVHLSDDRRAHLRTHRAVQQQRVECVHYVQRIAGQR